MSPKFAFFIVIVWSFKNIFAILLSVKICFRIRIFTKGCQYIHCQNQRYYNWIDRKLHYNKNYLAHKTKSMVLAISKLFNFIVLWLKITALKSRLQKYIVFCYLLSSCDWYSQYKSLCGQEIVTPLIQHSFQSIQL